MITSIPDLLIVGGVALLVFGPRRLPALAKSLGEGIREFKKAMEGESKDAEVLPPPQNTVEQKHISQNTQQPIPQN
jgi:sec-independent protein translocase protein TatA